MSSKLTDLPEATTVAEADQVMIRRASDYLRALVSLFRKPRHPGYVAGRWYKLAETSGAFSATACSATLPTAYPVVVTRTMSFDDVLIYCSTGAAGQTPNREIQVGIYTNDEANARPGTLIFSTKIDGTAGGAFFEASDKSGQTVTPTTLEPGVYWLAFISSSLSNGWGAFNANEGRGRSLVGHTDPDFILLSGIPNGLYGAATTYVAGLPSTWAASSNFVVTASATSQCPVVAFKAT